MHFSLLALLFAYCLFILDNLLRELMRTLKKARRAGSDIYDRKSSAVLVVYQLLMLLIPSIKLTGIGNIEFVLLQWFGLLFMMCGIPLHIWAMHVLGTSYTGKLTVNENHTLITKGPYKFVRHPGYAGVMLVALGFGLAISNWIAPIVAIGLFFGTHLYRMKQEETMLIKKFDDEYLAYTKKTKRVIPFVY